MSDAVIRIVNARQHNLQGHHRRAAAPRAHRHHRTLGLGQEFARVRHPLRRGAAPLHRVALHLRQAVPRADAQAAGGPARGDLAPVGGHRAAEPHRLAAARPSAPPPRCTTTCGCSGPGSAAATAGSAARRFGGTRRRAAADDVAGRRLPASRVQVCFPAAAGRLGSRTQASSRTSARSASCACWPTATPCHLDELPEGLDLTRADELLVVVDRLERRGRPHGRIAKSVATAFRRAKGSRSCCMRDGRAPALHPLPRLQRLRHAGGRGHPGPLLLQQPARRLRQLQRIRRRAGVRRVADRPRSGAEPRRRAPSTRGPSRATSRGAGFCSTSPQRSAPTPSKPWSQAQGHHRRELLHGKEGPLRRHLSLSQGTRGEALQAVHPGLPPAIPARADLLRRASGTRLNPDALAVRIGRDDHRRRGGAARWTAFTLARRARRSRRSEREIARPRPRPARRPSRLSPRRRASATSRSTGRPAPCRAARPSGSRSPTRSARGWWTRSTCSTSPRSACIRATPIACSPCCTGCATRATPSIVVEHDLAAIRQADFMLELGPGRGRAGRPRGPRGTGRRSASNSLTGQYLSGREADRRAEPARRPAGPCGSGCAAPRLHNLRGVDVDIPLGTLTAVTGVSRLGQEHAAARRDLPQPRGRLHGGHSAKCHLGEPVGAVASLTGWELLQDVLLVDQSPIGRSPRSNPITYIKGVRRDPGAVRGAAAGAAAEVLARHLFLQPAGRPLRRVRGRGARAGGDGLPGRRLRALRGVRRHPLPPRGARRPIQGHSIHDVLQWTVDEAITRFRHQPKLGAALWHLQQVGLGYLRLGQPATTLSGGEAQRLKIARELAQAGKKRGPEALHPRRADHRPAPRRRAGPDPGARPAGRCRAHRRRHRAPPRRDQAGRLDHRPRTRSGRRGRPGGGAGHARGGRRRSPGSHTGRYLRPLLLQPVGEAALAG